MLKFLRKLSGLQLWAIIITVIAAFALFESFSERDDSTVNINYTPSESSSQEMEVAAAETLPKYVVREHEGEIAVFERGGSLPVLRVKVNVSSLPDEDRLLLRSGKTFEDYGEMVAFLENYE